ncbi:hypothetical protein B0A48_15351 [Cryoendolithus antarcticus]|uniref:Uncharacterized protein n=1 Tax=Cryoendolithus antarcticus TaxID=1507870 RepID=A0A1V8SHQ7_9PEZI|nr:hypothetical protein B0A48_15351 [Cryoendolithus antarcticus]
MSHESEVLQKREKHDRGVMRIKMFMLELKHCELYNRWSSRLPDEVLQDYTLTFTTSPRRLAKWTAQLEHEQAGARSHHGRRNPHNAIRFDDFLKGQPLHSAIDSAIYDICDKDYRVWDLWDNLIMESIEKQRIPNETLEQLVEKCDSHELGECCNKDLAATDHLFAALGQGALAKHYQTAIKEFRNLFVWNYTRRGDYQFFCSFSDAREQGIVDLASLEIVAKAEALDGHASAKRVIDMMVANRTSMIAALAKGEIWDPSAKLSEALDEEACENHEELTQVCAFVDQEGWC